MSDRMKRLLAASVLALALAGQGTAMAGHTQGPDCHGSNQVACRPDPQPTHGNDCGSNAKIGPNSNDHCGADLPL